MSAHWYQLTRQWHLWGQRLPFISTSLESNVIGTEIMLSTSFWNWFELNHFLEHCHLLFPVPNHSVLYSSQPPPSNTPIHVHLPLQLSLFALPVKPRGFPPPALVSFQPWLAFLVCTLGLEIVAKINHKLTQLLLFPFMLYIFTCTFLCKSVLLTCFWLISYLSPCRS